MTCHITEDMRCRMVASAFMGYSEGKETFEWHYRCSPLEL